MNPLVAGYLKFRAHAYPERSELFQNLARTQHPGALFLNCSDSRVVPELLTQQEPGELFVVRNAGNIVPSYGPAPGGVSASLEYAVRSWLHYADAAAAVNASRHYATPGERLAALARDNVIAQFINLRTHPCVALALNQNRLPLQGWVFNIETGHVGALDGVTSRFYSLADNTHVLASTTPPDTQPNGDRYASHSSDP